MELGSRSASERAQQLGQVGLRTRGLHVDRDWQAVHIQEVNRPLAQLVNHAQVVTAADRAQIAFL